MTGSGATPGWYADAGDSALIRWWDGVSWTEHTQANPAAAPRADSLVTSPGRGGGVMPISEPVRLVPPASGSIPVAGFPGFDDPLPTAKLSSGPAPLAVPTPLPASVSTPWTSSSTFAQPTSAVDLSSVDYEPMTRSWGSGRPASAPRAITGVTTGGAWMLALSPLLQLGLAALGWLITDGGTTSATPYVAGGVGAAALLWIVLGAIADYRRLGALGHDFRPSVAWIVLGPLFYLLARAIHVYRSTRRGTAPTWVFVGLALIAGGVTSLAMLPA